SRTAPTFKDSAGGLPKGSTPVGQYHTHGDYSDAGFNRTNKAGVGGGHGLGRVLSSLSSLGSRLTGIVTTTDNGGSTGRIRRSEGG
ncbi:YvcK family protein, partial [Salmonella enterica subsp. enterica serovar Anatum]|nr:YvcK family protein [Salmonella enterica subsp. enterica serovar Anatum]